MRWLELNGKGNFQIWTLQRMDFKGWRGWWGWISKAGGPGIWSQGRNISTRAISCRRQYGDTQVSFLATIELSVHSLIHMMIKPKIIITFFTLAGFFIWRSWLCFWLNDKRPFIIFKGFPLSWDLAMTVFSLCQLHPRWPHGPFLLLLLPKVHLLPSFPSTKGEDDDDDGDDGDDYEVGLLPFYLTKTKKCPWYWNVLKFCSFIDLEGNSWIFGEIHNEEGDVFRVCGEIGCRRRLDPPEFPRDLVQTSFHAPATVLSWGSQ